MAQQFLQNLETNQVIRQKINDNFTEVYSLATQGFNAPGGSNAVGFLQSGVGALTNRTVQDKLRDLPTTQDFLPATARGFWTDSSPAGRVWRPLDRVFFGAAATEASGLADPGINKGWLGFEANGLMTYLETTSQVQCWHAEGGVAFAAASRSSDLPGSPFQGVPIGFGSYVTNDENGKSSDAWAFYGMADRAPGVAGGAIGIEVNVANRAGEVNLNPFNMGLAGKTAAAWLRTGGEVSESGATVAAASVALGIVRDGTNANARFLKGIVFGADAVKTYDGTNSIAMELGKNQEIRWVRDGSAARSGWIRSDATDASVGIVFTNGSFTLQNQSNQTAFAVQAAADSDNYLRFDSNSTGFAPGIVAVGADADISVIVQPKGSGDLLLAKAFPSGAVTPGNYFTIRDENGTVYRVPCQAM